MELENIKMLLEYPEIIQIGYVVKDLEAAKKTAAMILGVPVPESVYSGDYDVAKTIYKGKPAPNTACHMAFFYFGKLQVEFIEPVNMCESAWTDFINTTGGGLHHLAFKSKNIPKQIEVLKEHGIECVQMGNYRRGNGRYAFFKLGEECGNTYLELLESFED